MAAEDGKMRMTDAADTQLLFRLIQSIPSPKAEPFKLLNTNSAKFEKRKPAWQYDHTELTLNMLAEASTKDISQAVNPETFEKSKKVARQGGNVAKVAKRELEARTGKKVVTELNAKSVLQLKKGNDKENK